MNFSAEQFQTLMAAITGGQQQPVMPAAAPTPKNDPSVLGPIRQCSLGTETKCKSSYYSTNGLLDDAENRIDYIGVTEDKEKIILLKT